MIVQNDELSKFLLDDWAAFVLANGLQLRLFQNNFTPAHNSVVGAFTESTFTGYASATAVPSPPSSVDGAGLATLPYGNASYTFTGLSGGQTAYGWYLTDAGNTTVYAAEKFASPVVFSVALPVLVLQVTQTQRPQP